jgi:hypothetical protein
LYAVNSQAEPISTISTAPHTVFPETKDGLTEAQETIYQCQQTTSTKKRRCRRCLVGENYYDRKSPLPSEALQHPPTMVLCALRETSTSPRRLVGEQDLATCAAQSNWTSTEIVANAEEGTHIHVSYIDVHIHAII